MVARGTNELLTNQYFLGQLGYIRELVKVPPLLGSNVEFIGLYEAGKTYKLPLRPNPPNLPMDGAAGIIVNTIFGPVEHAGAVGDIRSMFHYVFAAFDRNSTTVTFNKLFCNEESNACPNRCTSRKERIEHLR